MWKNRSLRPAGDGFTLVELMVAITVLMIAVVGTVQAQLQALDLMRSSRESDVAMADLRAAMEELLLLSPAAIIAADTGVGATPPLKYVEGAPITSWSDRNLRNERIVVDYANWNAGDLVIADPLEIQLTSTWTTFKGGTRSLNLITKKTQ